MKAMSLSIDMQRLAERVAHPERMDAIEGTEADDDLLHMLDGLIRLSPTGVIVNPGAPKLLQGAEVAPLQSITAGFERAVAQGKAKLARSETGDLVPVLGPAGSPDLALLRSKGNYVKIKTYLWGFKVYLSHECVDHLTKGGTGAAGILTLFGVSAWIAAIVVAIVGVVASFDAKNKTGVTLFVAWPGVLLWIRSGKRL
jgi:hypothetical protein